MLVKDVKNKKRDIYLISNEELSGDIFSFYGNAKDIAERLKHVTDQLFRSITIIIYVREQTQWLHSVYTQQIHQGEAYDYEAFCKKIKSSSLDWARLIDPYIETFGSENVRIKQYDDEIIKCNGGLISDYIKEMGLTLKIDNTSIKREFNKSYSRTALALAVEINDNLDQRQNQNLRRNIQKAEISITKEKFSFLTRSELNEERERYMFH